MNTTAFCNLTILFFYGAVGALLLASVEAAPVQDERLLLLEVDPFAGHCPALCTFSANKKRNMANKMAQLHPTLASAMLSRYNSQTTCIDDCMCASYCSAFESLAGWDANLCMPICRAERPYSSGGDFAAKMADILLQA